MIVSNANESIKRIYDRNPRVKEYNDLNNDEKKRWKNIVKSYFRNIYNDHLPEHFDNKLNPGSAVRKKKILELQSSMTDDEEFFNNALINFSLGLST